MPGRMLAMMVTSLLCFVGFASSAFAECPSGQVSCNGKCVDLKSDEANCGSCGSTCKRAHACNQGSCQLECPDVQLACGNVCVTPASNPSHCGGCGKSCASNQYCSLGMCQQATCRGQCHASRRQAAILARCVGSLPSDLFRLI